MRQIVGYGENGPISWTEWNIVMKFCINILQDVAKEIVKCHFGLVEVQILKNSETGPISWNVLNILIKFCIHITIDVN